MAESTSSFPGESSPQQGSRFPEGSRRHHKRPKSNLVNTWFAKQLAAGRDMNSFPAGIVADDTASNRTAVISAVNEGGNARGVNAVDFQSLRHLVTEVASGDNSVIGGGRGNEASGDDSVVAGGDSNTASGYYAFIGSGEDNEATAKYSLVCGGYSNVASGYASAVGGGNYNTTSADYATVNGGCSNDASGYASVVSGGYRNTASGSYAAVSGGEDNEAGGDYALVSGRNMVLSAAADHSFLFGYAASTTTYTQSDAFITHGLRPFLSAPSTAPTDADLTNGQISFWLDETGNTITFRVKYSDGTLKTGTVALV